MENTPVLIHTGYRLEAIMKRNILPGLIIILLLLTIQGCFPAIRLFVYDGTHKGRVVDADTRKPIEGVVVLGVWRSVFATPGGAVSDFYDARETVTDKDGNFSVPGQGVLILSNVDVMQCLIFKAGYKYHRFDWDTLKEGRGQRMNVKWEDSKPIIPLKRLTVEERRRQHVPCPPDEALKEQIKLIQNEINKDRIERGLDPISVGR